MRYTIETLLADVRFKMFNSCLDDPPPALTRHEVNVTFNKSRKSSKAEAKGVIAGAGCGLYPYQVFGWRFETEIPTPLAVGLACVNNNFIDSTKVLDAYGKATSKRGSYLE